MKNLNLYIISLVFLSLLAGCGMAGPLYKEIASTPIKELKDQDTEVLIENTDMASSLENQDAINTQESTVNN